MFPGRRFRFRNGPTDKILPLRFKTKGQDNLESSSSWLRLCPAGSAPLFRDKAGASWNPGVAGRWTRFSLTLPPPKKTAPFTRHGPLSHSHPFPRAAFPGGDRSPRAPPDSQRRYLAFAGLCCSLVKLWPGLLSASVQVPGPATRELPARAPLKPGEAAPGKVKLSIPVLGLAQPGFGAKPRFGQRSREQPRPTRKTKDATPEPRTPSGPRRTVGRAGAEGPNRAPAGPGASRLRLRPWLLPWPGSGLPLHCLAGRGHRRAQCAGGRLWP